MTSYKVHCDQVVGWIAAPTGSGVSPGRGGLPRWYADRAAALRRCERIERAGWRDGGRGRDAYVVAVVLRGDGAIAVRAGGGDSGMYLGAGTAIQVGCSLHVADAIAWLRARPRAWMRSHGLGAKVTP